MVTNCWNCKKALDLPGGKVSFRATCDKCHSDLHCCKNCRFYKPGHPNDCLVPGTDWISDRSLNNFCDEFKIRESESSQEKPDTKKRFEDLFKD